jgi:hypothetical protein
LRNCTISEATPSEVFSATLPTKPSQTTTSTVPLKMSLPSTLPDEVHVAGRADRAQQLAGALDRLVALDLFLADVQQPDARVLLAVDGRDQRAAHHRELQQVLGGAVDVGAEVQHGGVAAELVRHHRGDRRAVDALERLQHVARHRHQRAGVAGRDAGVRGGARRRRRPCTG